MLAVVVVAVLVVMVLWYRVLVAVITALCLSFLKESQEKK